MAPKEIDRYNARDMMEEIKEGKLEDLDSADWAYKAQRRVWEGSDGLWMRFGLSPPKKEWDMECECGYSSDCLSRLFAFQFNPCVSLSSLLLLIGITVFCMMPVDKYCSRAYQKFEFTITSSQGVATTYTARKHSFQPTSLHANQYRLTILTGGQIGAEAEPIAQMSGDHIVFPSQNFSVPVTNNTLLESYDCFMPKKEFTDWMAWTTLHFTWLYIITQDVWIVFIIYLACSKYGTEKIGRANDEPEYNYFEWFAMLFTCGVATGLFYFGVSEPQYMYLAPRVNAAYSSTSRWTYSGVYLDDNGIEHGVFKTPTQRAQDAMTATWYHWGVHAWVCYCILGLLLSFLHYRKGLPMTIKTCFYPLIGDRIYGFMGDLVDTFSVVATTMGVCTSLGMGVIQLSTGIEMLNGDKHWLGTGYYNEYNLAEWEGKYGQLKTMWDSWDQGSKQKYPWYENNNQVNVASAAAVATLEAQTDQQILLIWIITAGSTVSVLLGMKWGLKYVAMVCLALGQFVICYMWMMDDSYFLANLFVQTIGHYIQQLPVIGFYTSAIEQSEARDTYGEYQSWMNSWTLFYWGWWISWTPFVGVFLARLGKGRTVREFIACTLLAATSYNWIFLTVLGGSGLKMQMLAEKYKIGTSSCDDTMVDIPGGSGKYREKGYKKNVCRHVSTRKYSGEKEYMCSTVVNLACSMQRGGERPLFDVVSQYADLGKAMTVFVLITIIFYFIASSDSGSMVDDIITANGLKDPCLTQRLIWSLTEGACATALVSTAKHIGTSDGALRALRSASICVGLPYTFLICFMCVALYRALQYEKEERIWERDGFRESVFDIGIKVYDSTPCFQSKDNKRELISNRGRFSLNFKEGRISRDFSKILYYLVFPISPIIDIRVFIQANLERIETEKQKGTIGVGVPKGPVDDGSAKNGCCICGPKIDAEKRKHIRLIISGVVMMVLLYTFVGLQLFDQFPISSTPTSWGSQMGDANTIKGNTRYDLSTRWGYFHEWANKDSERADGATIKWNDQVNAASQEVPLKATVDGDSLGKTVGIGERFAYNYRVAVVGWFLFFVFVTYLTALRNQTRKVLPNPILGSLAEDFAVCCLWPLALRQMLKEFEINQFKEAYKASDETGIKDLKIDFL